MPRQQPISFIFFFFLLSSEKKHCCEGCSLLVQFRPPFQFTHASFSAMALRAVFHRTKGRDIAFLFSSTRSAHAVALPVSDNQVVAYPPPLSLPEFGFSSGSFPHFASGGGSMELMAVPKRKTSPHKRGIRNGPKALKPIPVIIRCNNCGKVKLPHFYCCGGRREGAFEK